MIIKVYDTIQSILYHDAWPCKYVLILSFYFIADSEAHVCVCVCVNIYMYIYLLYLYTRNIIVHTTFQNIHSLPTKSLVMYASLLAWTSVLLILCSYFWKLLTKRNRARM